MANVTFQVLDGVDRGRVYRDLPTPVTIGREEGNILRLNDERVSRFHAKVQQDQGDLILTDLDSTNGTKVNGNVVQIRRLRHGDCVTIGRSVLLFGSNEEIAARLATLAAGQTGATGEAATGSSRSSLGPALSVPSTLPAPPTDLPFNDPDLAFDIKPDDSVKVADEALFVGKKAMPPLPRQLTPSQAARLSEILDFLHRGLAQATEAIRANDDGTSVSLDFSTWQKVLAAQLLLARYLKAVVDPGRDGDQ